MSALHRCLAALLLLAVPAAQAPAAQIEIVASRDPPRTWLRIAQSIAPGDERVFRELAGRAPGGAVVVLSGPGGSVSAALAIGREIQARRLGTLVPPNAACASACSLIWLAGARRQLGEGARIGFHAASVQCADGSRVETHAFDWVLRGYPTGLGFATDVVATIVATPSTRVRWLDAIELRANCIATEPFP